MKFLADKKNGKKITIILLIVMLFNLACPKATNAGWNEFGGKLFKPIAQLLRGVGDLTIQGLQLIFINNSGIEDSGDYKIRYSPGIIFSNILPIFDVNFFNPPDDYKISDYKIQNTGTETVSIPHDKIVPQGDETQTGAILRYYGYNDSTEKKQGTDYFSWTVYGENGTRKEYKLKWEVKIVNGAGKEVAIGEDPRRQPGYSSRPTSTNSSSTSTNSGTSGITSTTEYTLTVTNYERLFTDIGEAKSISKELQPMVATWYKALRAIALVGLLSVLVYVGIRILISSTGQEKAKYKKVIIDWLAALCLLFVLHYIMLFTLEIVNKITEVLSVSVVGIGGQDELMSNVRNELGDGDKFSEIFSELLIYVVLVIHTVIFTIQYLKRLLYMAFFTMIAPLVALTYPLDKIKDGKAQAFSIWLREYIFNALLQPMHLLLYVIFVSSASSLVQENWIYAIVAIGFLVPAEKFFRKMFGFEQASSASPIGAAAGGALIMNAINKMGQKAGKHAAGGKGSGSSGEKGGGQSPRYAPSPNSSSGGSGGGSASGSGSGNGGAGSGSGGTTGGSSGGTQQWGQTVNPAGAAGGKSFINGAKTLAGRYNPLNRGNRAKLAKGAGRLARKGIIGAAGAATLGTVGLAAGIATGDAGKALSYGAAGAGVGFAGANALGDKAVAFEKKNREIFKEGMLGTEEYNTRGSIQELTRDNDFNSVCKQLGVRDQAGREALIREYHSNGITNSSEIKKSMNIRARTGASQSEVIAAQRIMQQAQRDGMKRKDIEASLRGRGVTGASLDKAMSIIDML